jgi:signal transduction histidine kinase
VSAKPWDDTDLAAARLRSLARVVRAVGHDARGALGTVTLHGTLLVKALEADAPPSPERTRRWASGMRDGCVRVERLLDAMLGHLAAPRGADAALAPVVAGLLTLARPYAFARQVGVAVSDGVVHGPVVPEVVRQVLLDVLLAAIEATAEGGEIAVATVADGTTATVTITGPTASPELAATLAGWSRALAASGATAQTGSGGAFAATIDIRTLQTEETGT